MRPSSHVFFWLILFSDASLMQLWNRSITSSRLRRLGCGVLGASEAARERRRTEAARAAARARARSSWSSLEPSGKAGGGDCSSNREPAAIPRAGGGVGAGGGPAVEASSVGGISGRGRQSRNGGRILGAFGGFSVVWELGSFEVWSLCRSASLPGVNFQIFGAEILHLR